MKRLDCCLGGLIGLMIAVPAQAQQTIVVTASRTTADQPETTVLDAAQIGRLQPVTLLEPLGRVAGVRAFNKGGLTYLSIRGGEPNFTLVLLDGVRLNDPTNSRGGAFDFEQIDPYAIDRIEIARTGLSAVHGADALSGVVHLRLREPRPAETFAGGRGSVDSECAIGISATAGHGWASGGILASAGWFDSGSLFEGAGFERRQALARLSQRFGPIAANILALHGNAGRSAFPEDSGGPRLAIVRERERRDTALTIASLALSLPDDERIQPRIALNWSRLDSDTETPSIAPGLLPGVPRIVADSRFDRFEAVADVRLRPTDRLTVAAGASFIREHGRSAGFIDFGFPLPADFEIRRSLRSLFAEASLALAPIQLNGGLRYDDASRGGANLSLRAGARISIDRSLTAFADYAEGYKLPSLFALAYPVIANPDLEPERGRSITVGLEHRADRRQLRLALFSNRFTNLIDFDVERFTNVNRSRVRTRGVEFDTVISLGPALTFSGALSWLDVDNAPGAPPLRSRPQLQGSATLDWRPTPKLSFALAGRFNDAYFDSSIPTGLIRRSGHAELDAAASWQITQALTLRIAARNLADAEYEDAVGFPAPGRVVRVSLGAAF